MSNSDWARLLALSLLWGATFFYVEIALTALPPLTIVLARVGLGALALALVLRLRGIALPRGARLWAAFLVMGVLNNVVPFTLFAGAQAQIASGLAAILNATTPLFTILVAHLLTGDERITPAKAAGLAIGFGGVVVLVGGVALAPVGAAVVLAYLACLAASVSYAFAAVYGRRFARAGVAPLQVAFGQVTASALVLAPLVALVDAPWRLGMPPAQVWAALAGLSVLSTAVAYGLYFRLLASAGPTNLLLVTFLIPVTALALGIGVLGERLEPRHIAGMALIAAGLVAIDGRAWRAIRGASAGNSR
jgi:drug/metabolite transporter (DMT)-like permease